MTDLPSSEILSEAEVEELTGSPRRHCQIEWLTTKGWIFEVSRGGRPIVSRYYFRLRMAGIQVSAAGGMALGTAEPDWSGVR